MTLNNSIGDPYPGPYDVSTVEGIGYVRDNEGAIIIRARDVADPEYTVPLARVMLTVPAKRGQKYNTHDRRQLGTAHLLAATWDLREALQTAVTLLQQGTAGVLYDREAVIKQGLAALAKARGDGFAAMLDAANAAFREKLKRE